MIRKWAARAITALVLASAAGAGALGQDQTTPKPNDAGPAFAGANEAADKSDSAVPELAADTVDRAAKANKYVFLFFYRTEDETTQAARKTFDAAMAKLAERALSAVVNVTSPLDRPLVTKYGLDRSPTPLVLALAPNGAVTRSFTGQVAAPQFDTAFVSSGAQKCLKALQDRKMVFLCVQNGTTPHGAEAMQGVRDFSADAQYAKTTEIITIDPADAGEESFLKQLKVDPKTDEAVTVFLAPPGAMVGTYKGETKKDVLIAAAKTAAKGCTPGGSCCPAPKKAAESQPGASKKTNP